MPTRVAIDVGGTFTDLCALNEDTGEFVFVKDLTTPSNFAIGVLGVLKKSGIKGEEIDRFIGTGSTMVINSLTERKGAKVLLVTTKGFRDVLEIQRSNRTDLYNFRYQKPIPFVPRRYRIEVEERIDYSGNILKPLNKEDVLKAIEFCKRERFESVAIAFFNSYANPAHEIECYNLFKKALPNMPITLSHELTREWREYERTNTAVMNAFVQPKVQQYIETLEKGLRDFGVKTPLHIMQSNGGVSTFEQALRAPIYQVESGPIGGVIGSATIGKALGLKNIITLDVGGTTAKTSLIFDGKLRINTDYSIGKTQFFPGYPVKVPVVDIVEIGNGGGSIAWIDEVGSLRVGPVSAGADPGPACYNRGGDKPTLTDAFVITGVLNPDYFLGGEIKLNKELAYRAYSSLSEIMGKSVEEVALGAIRLATANMINAVKLISVRRGFDPRDFTLIAFGGAGPMFATAIAKDLLIKKVIVPRVPGVFSAWGMLMTDVKHDYVQTKVMRLNLDSLKELYNIINEMKEMAMKQLESEYINKNDMYFEAYFDIRYLGQEHTVSTEVPIKNPDRKVLKIIENRFHRLHYKQYTFKLNDPLEVVNVRLSAYGKVRKPQISTFKPKEKSFGVNYRKVILEDGMYNAKVLRRDEIQYDETILGPAIIEEPTATTVVRNNELAYIDKFGNLIIEVK